jgi:hypothetical protein
MRVRLFAILLCGVCAPVVTGAQTAAAPAQAQPQTQAQPVAPAGPTPTAIMQPSLDTLRDAISGMHADKWKIPAVLRDETETNLSSIRRDLEGTLPVLLADADKGGTVSSMLPAYRNIEALYDVVLRVDAAARVGAPGQQSAAVDQALSKLDEARRGFGDHVLAGVQAQEKQVTDLQAALKAVPAPAPAPVCPAPPPAPAKKPAAKKPAPKPAAKPATPPATPPTQG